MEPLCLFGRVPAIVFVTGTASTEGRHDVESYFTRVRPYAKLAAEALISEYFADAAASRWDRQRLLYIGSEDGDSVLRDIPADVMSLIADAMNPHRCLTATSS